jgi:septal ring-binding cell division protein DamX
MTMRRTLPHLIALLLGVGAALLAACGQTTRGGIPAADASVLKHQLEDVRGRVADGRCDQLASSLRRVNTSIDGLPRAVDARLVQALRNGADRLQRRAVADCNANNVPTETQTAPTVTETVPTQTDTTTTPTDTTTTPPDTTTTPPDTTTTPTPTDTIQTLPTEPPPPPSGGVSPEVP